MINLAAIKLDPELKDFTAQKLRNWGVCVEALMKCSIHEVEQLIVAEIKGRKRLSILGRLINRYNTLDNYRSERAVMAAIAKTDEMAPEEIHRGT